MQNHDSPTRVFKQKQRRFVPSGNLITFVTSTYTRKIPWSAFLSSIRNGVKWRQLHWFVFSILFLIMPKCVTGCSEMIIIIILSYLFHCFSADFSFPYYSSSNYFLIFYFLSICSDIIPGFYLQLFRFILFPF